MYEIVVNHTIDAAHRVVGHRASDGTPGKCARLHGHTYAFVVTIAGDHLDGIGFVIDFGVVKGVLNEWDHRTLLWDDDPLHVTNGTDGHRWADYESEYGVVRLPFNPTAENMARHLAERILALDDGVRFAEVAVSETAKTNATWRATRSWTLTHDDAVRAMDELAKAAAKVSP